jgi:histidinol phosphatase-like enzyme
MKLLFIDIDGVLNSENWFRQNIDQEHIDLMIALLNNKL